MELMKKIILSACFLSIVITIADSIKPGDKFSRQLKMLFSLVFITGIVSAALRCDFSFDFPAFADIENYDAYNNMENTAENAVKEETEKEINEYVGNLLTDHGIEYEKITSYVNISEDSSISIDRIDYKGSEFEQACDVIKMNLEITEVNQVE